MTSSIFNQDFYHMPHSLNPRSLDDRRDPIPLGNLRDFNKLTSERTTFRTYLFRGNAYSYTSQVQVIGVFACGATDNPELHFRARKIFDKIPENGFIVVTDRTLFHAKHAGQPEDRGLMHSHYCKNETNVVFTIIDVRDNHPGPVYHLGTFEPDRVPFEKGQLVIQCVQPERRLFRSRVHVAGHLIGIAVERLVEKGVIDGIRSFKAVYCQPHWIVEFDGLIGRENKHAMVQINEELKELVKKDAKCHLRHWSIEKGMEMRASMRKVVLGPETKQVVRFIEIDGIGVYACSNCPFVSKIGVLGRIKVVSIHLHQKKDVTRMWYGIQLEAP